jgi:hypothetical protein
MLDGAWVWFLLIGLSLFSEQAHGMMGRKASSGVYTEELPPPLLYETIVPVILEYTLPRWNKTDVTFNNWYNCTSEVQPYRYTCPIVYHMNQAVLNLHIDFESLQPVQDQVPHTGFYSRLQSSSDFCTLIQKHFSASFIQQSELNAYIQALEKCVEGGGLIHLERDLPNYSFPIRNPFTTMENRFYNTFYTKIQASNNGTLDLVASAALSNARSTIQALLLSHYYAERNRWFHATESCRSGILPHTLITAEKFANILDTISKQAGFKDYEFSIPTSMTSKYYDIPMADCSFTNETFVVRLLVPLNRKEANPEAIKLLRVNAVPFTIDGKICSIWLPQENFLFDSSRQLAFATQCKPNELCKLSKAYHMANLQPCVSALVSGNFNVTKANCAFMCYSFDEANFMEEGLLTRVAPDRFVVSGQDGTVASVECARDPGNNIEVRFEKEETLELTLPCECKIQLGRNGAFFSEPPCGVDLITAELIPWRLLRNPEDLEVDRDEMAYVRDRIQRQPRPRPVPPAEKLPGAEQVTSTESSHAPLWIFFGLITLILFLLQLYIYYELRQVRGVKGLPLQTWFRARDPESESRLIDSNIHM